MNLYNPGFDSIQIFVTRHDSSNDGGTLHVESGTGNWYARYGQVKDWIARQEEIARKETRNEEP